MKKVILSALAICAFGFANAQDKGSDSGMRFGVKGGVQFTNFTGDGEWNGKTGFYVGGLVDFTVGENFHVQPELLYSMEGAEQDFEGETFDYGVSYLRIPIMAKYYIMEGLNLQAGPEIAFKVGTAEDYADESIKSMDFGIGVGAGYELTNGLMFDLRYNLGLSNIAEEVDGESPDVKNTGIQLGLGYRF
ncbi:MAG: PorT family protein [Flavobacterium sp.]|nr:MAG: PorT family protein [Flavobacterium sp.]